MEKNKNSLNKFKSDLSDSYKWNKPKKVLIFSFNEEFIKLFTQVAYSRFEFLISSWQDLDSFITKLIFPNFQVIYLDVDFIFSRLHEVLTHINTGILINLVTSSKENHFQLVELSHPKNILLLWEGKDIKYLKNGKQYIY